MTKDNQKDLFSQASTILSVSDYIELINAHLEILRDIAVEGEVSEFKISQQKWVTFRLKDEKSSIECFMVIFRLTVPLEDGMKIRVYGRPRVYPRYGKFSINVEDIELAGEGTLKRAFEITKARLKTEGLFDEDRKRRLPIFPEHIGLITSEEAAAYTDFIKVLGHRFGGLKIYFTPVKVQGKEAIQEIVGAFDWFNEHCKKHNIELVVLTRGGGSLEDLQAFNSEDVARAVFSSKIPVVCAVGHERDESLADFVADLRASTPSNAAELIVRDRKEVIVEIDTLVDGIEAVLENQIQERRRMLEQFSLKGSHLISDKSNEVKRALLVFAEKIQSFNKNLSQKQLEINFLLQNIESRLKNKLVNFGKAIDQYASLLKSYNPLEVLRRGYSILRHKNGKLIKDTRNLNLEEIVEAILYQGSFEAKINKINHL